MIFYDLIWKYFIYFKVKYIRNDIKKTFMLKSKFKIIA